VLFVDWLFGLLSVIVNLIALWLDVTKSSSSNHSSTSAAAFQVVSVMSMKLLPFGGWNVGGLPS
jgi:hypothetical protein